MEQALGRRGGLAIPPPYPSPFLWDRVFASPLPPGGGSAKWMRPGHNFSFHHTQYCHAEQGTGRDNNVANSHRHHPRTGGARRGSLVFNQHWLAQFRERRQAEGHQEMIEQAEQKRLRKNKKRTKGKGTAWYKNYIPKKHVEDIDPIEVGLSPEEKAVEMLEAALDSRFDSMAKETGAEYWPAIPMR